MFSNMCRKEIKEDSYVKYKICKKVLHYVCITKKFKKDINAVSKFEETKRNYQCDICIQFNDPIFIPEDRDNGFISHERFGELQENGVERLMIMYEKDDIPVELSTQ